MAFLLEPLKALLIWLAQKILWSWVDAIKAEYDKRQKKALQDKIDKENLEKYKHAIENKLPDQEVSKRAEDLLNGINR